MLRSRRCDDLLQETAADNMRHQRTLLDCRFVV
jgi:hypothetical protein